MNDVSRRRGRRPAEVVPIDERRRDAAVIQRMIRRLDELRARPSCGTGERLVRLTAARVLLERALDADS